MLHFLTTLNARASLDRVESTKAPSIFILLQWNTWIPLMSNEKSADFARFLFEPTRMKFVFLSFSFKEFEPNQAFSSRIVSSSLAFGLARPNWSGDRNQHEH